MDFAKRIIENPGKLFTQSIFLNSYMTIHIVVIVYETVFALAHFGYCQNFSRNEAIKFPVRINVDF